MQLGIVGRLAAVCAGLVALAGCASVQRLGHLTSSPCRDTTVTLYFDEGSDAVSDIGREIVKATSQRLRTCKVRELDLLGLSDPVGTPQSNLELSKRRAQNVLDAFVAAGLPVQSFTLVARGEAGAQSASGVITPVRRRVDVTVVMKK